LTQKGGNKANEGKSIITTDFKELARDKLNSEMDYYWRQKKEEQ